MLIIFDLDGTLTDPKEGITKRVQYALADQGIQASLEELTPFIGPPLLDSFQRFYGLDPQQAQQAVQKYRERFSKVGKYENIVYPGIREMLAKLKANGHRLAIGSSKPEVYVLDILKHFDLDKYFDVITGSELDGSRIHKAEVIDEIFKRLASSSKAIMVGDRKFDVEGAHEHHIPCIGVTYGYGQENELANANADWLANSVFETEQILLENSNV